MSIGHISSCNYQYCLVVASTNQELSLNTMHYSLKPSSSSSSIFPPNNLVSEKNLPLLKFVQCKRRSKMMKIFSTATSTPRTILAHEEHSSIPGNQEKEDQEKFEWYEHWYPVMPVCDLDKRRPHGKKVMGIDIVVWWDRNEKEWKVFEDSCPHRLAPLSQGRIDQWGRLQCVYHGWCFGGSGDCKFIPQAPRDGPPIHSCKKACVGVYPSCVQNKIVWFWPNSHHEYKDIASRKKPPYIPEIDDPSFTCSMMARDVPYGYEFLIENLMDPTHVPYAHHGIMKMSRPSTSDEKADREGGKPVDLRVGESGIHGFTTRWMDEDSDGVFVPPCIFTASINFGIPSSSSPEQKRLVLVFMCVPVSPGKSRVIIAEPRNFALWMDHVIPRWVFHMHHNLLLDSDLYLLHLEERKIRERGTINWHKACYVPTKADANVVAFRRWFNNYSGAHVHWTSNLINANHLPPTPPKLQLMDRYRSHTKNCSSCSAACERLNTLELLLHAFSFVSLGIVAALKPSVLPMAVTKSMALASLLCFLAAKCLSHFIHKTFHFHDYDHAFR